MPRSSEQAAGLPTRAASASKPPKNWGDTPEPAQVGHRVAEGVFHEKVPLERAGEVTQVAHWLYGTGWDAVYGVLEESIRRPLLSGVALTSVVVGTDHTLLPAMKLYKPPWQYPAKTLGKDFGVHLVHGLATAVAYRALEPLFNRSA